MSPRRPAAPRRRGAHPARPRQSAERQRQRLIDACISALHIHGPSRTTVARVVAIARLSPGVVRFYFRSKASMLVASLRFLATEFEQQVLQPVAGLRDTPVAALCRMVELYLDPAIASTRKISVWYAFWGEATARQEYLDICGEKDERFAALVREIIGRMIRESRLTHLDEDAIALGLMGALEIIWQGFAFQSEQQVDRAGARRRCMAYLASVFPGHFPRPATAAGARQAPQAQPFGPCWQLAGHAQELRASGEYLAVELAASRVLVLRDGDGLRAFRNRCPRQPHALALERRGRFTGRIACPLHRLQFGLDGEPRPAGASPALVPAQLREAGGFVLVAADAPAAPPPAAGALLPDGRLRPIDATSRYAEFDVAADWRVAVEQLLLHRMPEQGGGVGLQSFSEPSFALDSGRRQLRWRAAPAGGDGWSAQRLAGIAPPRDSPAWERLFLWPNLLLEFRPDGATALQVIPLAPGASRWQCFDYGYADLDARQRAQRFLARRVAARVLQYDRALAASTQRGLSAPDYLDGQQEPPPGRAVAAFRQLAG